MGRSHAVLPELSYIFLLSLCFRFSFDLFFSFASLKATIHPNNLSCCTVFMETMSAEICPNLDSFSTMKTDDGLVLLPFSSVPARSTYGVTPSTSHMIRIFSDTWFVFFLFQSLIAICATRVFPANFFWLLHRFCSKSNMVSDSMSVVLTPLVMELDWFYMWNYHKSNFVRQYGLFCLLKFYSGQVLIFDWNRISKK